MALEPKICHLLPIFKFVLKNNTSWLTKDIVQIFEGINPYMTKNNGYHLFKQAMCYHISAYVSYCPHITQNNTKTP